MIRIDLLRAQLAYTSPTKPFRPLLSANVVGSIILRAVEEKKPFSFVRTGDAEGALLLYDEKATDADVSYLQSHFGPAAGSQIFLPVAEKLRKTLAAADLLGVRDDIWFADDAALGLTGDEENFCDDFRRYLLLREAEKNIDPHALRRLFGIYRWAKTQLPASVPLCSSWVAYDLALSGFWKTLLSTQRSIGLIHCSRTLADHLRKCFGLDVEHIHIPDKHVHRERWPDDPGDWNHYPDTFQRVSSLLDRPLKGKLFLLGAGLMGKNYAAIVKSMGGIAVDVGSLLDAWDNRSTRPLVYATKGDPDHSSHLPFMLERAPKSNFRQ